MTVREVTDPQPTRWIIWTNQTTGEIGIRGDVKPTPGEEVEVVPLSEAEAKVRHERELVDGLMDDLGRTKAERDEARAEAERLRTIHTTVPIGPDRVAELEGALERIGHEVDNPGPATSAARLANIGAIIDAPTPQPSEGEE